ncbi:MAG: nucleic acid-binding protein [Chloroflexi bacterium HGW-Chloroflexi-5]|jgi:hypothetical protein|nr:MAG: nucleic acid-binding protein [Deltaproteobacteria bacterium HGW-Deltaproteobacteria-12]PKN96157.1 MAG: nucleic acid-binding protein [Chloroflexi bacterium HGW-Chloroflexi-5]
MTKLEYKLTFKDYNANLKKNKLMGLKCNQCGHYTCPPKLVCHECGCTNMEIVVMSGQGKIVTFTVSYVTAQAREIEAPIIVVMVEMKEGPWIMGNLMGIDPERATMESLIGKYVSLTRTRMLPADPYAGGNEVKDGIARPTFSL